jgi:predicted translin family RNA/ssDNA-binding protein
MNLQEYQQAAIRTESIPDNIKVNKRFALALATMFVRTTDVLDALKKAVIYNNPAKMDYYLEDYLREIKYLLETVDSHMYTWHQHVDKEDEIKIDTRVFHGILGMATESGELMNVLVENMRSKKPVDAVNVHEEMHDSSWYMAIIHDALGLDWSEGLARNIAKLKARYPEKFTEHHANNRDLDAERAILEGKQ